MFVLLFVDQEVIFTTHEGSKGSIIIKHGVDLEITDKVSKYMRDDRLRIKSKMNLLKLFQKHFKEKLLHIINLVIFCNLNTHLSSKYQIIIQKKHTF